MGFSNIKGKIQKVDVCGTCYVKLNNCYLVQFIHSYELQVMSAICDNYCHSHLHTVADQVMSQPCVWKKAPLEMNWVEEGNGSSDSESEEESNQIEVSHVPSSVTERLLKAYFEMPKSGGQKGAVIDCKDLGKGVFLVTFCDPKGVQRF